MPPAKEAAGSVAGSKLLRLAISLALLGLVLGKAGLDETLAELKTAEPIGFALSFLLSLVGILVRAWRWQGLLQALGIRAGLARLSELYLIGAFFSQLVPTGVGGDVARVYLLSREGVAASRVTGSVLADRATGLVSLLLIGSCVAWLHRRWMPVGITRLLIGLTLLVILGAAILLTRPFLNFCSRMAAVVNPRLGAALLSFHDSIRSFRSGVIGRALLISMGFNFTLVLIHYLLARSLNLMVSLETFFLFVPLISATLLLPISLGGLGPREWAFVFLLGTVGVSHSAALALSLMVYGLNLSMALVGAGFLLFRNLRPRPDERRAA